MSIFTKEIVSVDNVAWLGFKRGFNHFMLTGVVLLVTNILSVFVIGFWFLFASDLTVYSVLIVMLFISVCVSSFYFRKKYDGKVSFNKVLNWSFVFFVFIFGYLVLAYPGVMSALETISVLLMLVVYYSTAYFIFRKSKQTLNV